MEMGSPLQSSLHSSKYDQERAVSPTSRYLVFVWFQRNFSSCDKYKRSDQIFHKYFSDFLAVVWC